MLYIQRVSVPKVLGGPNSGKEQDEHDANLECFLEAAERKNITYNEEKSVFSTRRLTILGSIVEEGEILPDPQRLRPLPRAPCPQQYKVAQ